MQTTPVENYSSHVDHTETHIILKTDNEEEAQSYLLYAPYIKASYEEKQHLILNIDAAELNVGQISGAFYPVIIGIWKGEQVRMIFTDYEWDSSHQLIPEQL